MLACGGPLAYSHNALLALATEVERNSSSDGQTISQRTTPIQTMSRKTRLLVQSAHLANVGTLAYQLRAPSLASSITDDKMSALEYAACEACLT
jgi:hypothetical protein